MIKLTWSPMDALHFVDGLELWVSDGERVAPVIIDRRFGTPMWIYERRDTVPTWLLEWAFSDQDAEKNYCSSGPLPDDQIDFIPTHWMPRNVRPAPPTV